MRWATVHRTLTTNGRKSSSKDTKQYEEEKIAFLGRERIYNQWILQKQVIGVWIWKEKGNMKFNLPLSTRHYRHWFEIANFHKSSYPSPASASFPQIPSASSRVSGMSQQVPSWSPETVGEKKHFSLYPLPFWILG